MGEVAKNHLRASATKINILWIFNENTTDFHASWDRCHE